MSHPYGNQLFFYVDTKFEIDPRLFASTSNMKFRRYPSSCFRIGTMRTDRHKRLYQYTYDASSYDSRTEWFRFWICSQEFKQILNSCFLASWINVNKKVQLDARVCRHLFTAESLYMFRAPQHPSLGALKTVTATSGIGHNTGVLWPIPEVAVIVFSTPDDGHRDARNRNM